jgi:hypothetical protein
VKRFNIVKLNNLFFVTDSTFAHLKALTPGGRPADITSPGDVKYFQMDQATAQAVADALNETYKPGDRLPGQ